MQQESSSIAPPPATYPDPAASGGSGPIKIWTVTIDRSSGLDKSLGITVDPMDEKQLIIQIMKPVGLVEDYNSKQSDASLQLKKGDRIVEVNGVRGDAKSMLTECQKIQ